MKNFRKVISALLAVFLFAVMLWQPVSAFADAGGFSGDSDWGSSDWSWSDDDDDWGSDWDDDDDDDYYGGGTTIIYGGGGGGYGGYDRIDSGGIDIFTIILVIVIILIIVSIIKKRSGYSAATQNYSASQPPMTRAEMTENLAALKERDPNFSEQRILEKVGNQYVQLQNAWTNKDLAPLRYIMTDAMYSQFDRQLAELKANNLTNYVDRIAVLNSQIWGCGKEGDNDVLYVRLETRIVDYTVDDMSGECVSGSKDVEKFMGYEWKLIRSSSKLTGETDDLSAVNCPNCGAPLSINHSGQCEYCGTVITLSEHDWALSSVRGLYQKTAR